MCPEVPRRAERQHFSLHASIEEVVAHLVCGEMSGALALAHHRDIVVGDTVVADLAGLLERFEGAPIVSS